MGVHQELEIRFHSPNTEFESKDQTNQIQAVSTATQQVPLNE